MPVKRRRLLFRISRRFTRPRPGRAPFKIAILPRPPGRASARSAPELVATAIEYPPISPPAFRRPWLDSPRAPLNAPAPRAAMSVAIADFPRLFAWPSVARFSFTPPLRQRPRPFLVHHPPPSPFYAPRSASSVYCKESRSASITRSHVTLPPSVR